MRFEVPVRGVQCLPEAVEIGLAALGAGRDVALALGIARPRQDGEEGGAQERRNRRPPHFRLPRALAVASAPSLARKKAFPSARSYWTPATRFDPSRDP